MRVFCQLYAEDWNGKAPSDMPFTIELGESWYSTHFYRVVVLLLALERDAELCCSILNRIEPTTEGERLPAIDEVLMDEAIMHLLHRVLGLPQYMPDDGLVGLLQTAQGENRGEREQDRCSVRVRDLETRTRVLRGSGVICSDMLPHFIRSGCLFEGDVPTRVDPLSWCSVLGLMPVGAL